MFLWKKTLIKKSAIEKVGFASGPDGLTIIEYDKKSGKYYITFHDTLDDEGFEDFDGDGTYELYGLNGSTTGGAVLYDREEMAFKLKNHKYVQSYNVTRLMLIKMQKEEEEKYYQNPVITDRFFHLLLLDGKLGLIEKGEQLIEKYIELKGDAPLDRLKDEFQGYIEGYQKNWWEKLKKESKE